MFWLIWVSSIILTGIIAERKKMSVALCVVLSIFLGPLMALIVAVMPSLEKGPAPVLPEPVLPAASLKSEIEELKNEQDRLNQKIAALEIKLGVLRDAQEPVVAVSREMPVELVVPQAEEPVAAVDVSPAPHKDVEMDLGKFWLNKIGIVIFALGVGFLITYAFKYFGPLLRIASGYVICAALFFLGLRLEKKGGLVNFGRVLLGGAWALTYFTTYAMYHFEASRVISSQAFDLVLLGLVAMGIIWHSLRYRFEALTATALFIGYLTCTMGDINAYSLSSALVLSLAALFVIWRMNWTRLIFLGIGFAYVTHLAWVIKHLAFSLVPAGTLNVENVLFLLDGGFLTMYWFIFSAAIHLIVRPQEEKKLAAANFANIAFYSALILPKLYYFYPSQKFNFLFALGAVYLVLVGLTERTRRPHLMVSNAVIAVALLTMAVALKFTPYHASIIWFIELPFLLFVGFVFDRPVYRFLGLGLAGFLFMRMFSLSLLPLVKTLTAVGSVSTALCYLLYYSFQGKTLPSERPLQRFYSFFSLYYLVRFIFAGVDPLWLSVSLFSLALIALALGGILKDIFLRLCSLVVLAVAVAEFCFYDRYSGVGEGFQAALIGLKLALSFGYYALYRWLKKKQMLSGLEHPYVGWLFFPAASLVVYSIFAYVLSYWITISLEAVVILSLLWGVRTNYRPIRYYSLIVLSAALFRYCLVDSYAGLGSLMQWMLIGIKLAGAYAVFVIYFLLRRRGLSERQEERVPDVLFYSCTFLVVFTALRYVASAWVAVSLGFAGLALFLLGFLCKDKMFRLGGFILFGITLARIVFIDLSGLPIIYKIVSFIVLGLVFLAVSFFYSNYSGGKRDGS